MFTYNSHRRADEDAVENAPIEVKAVADVRQVGTVHSDHTRPNHLLSTQQPTATD